MSAILSNILKSQKSHLHQWKPENNGPVLVKVASSAMKLSVRAFQSEWRGFRGGGS